MTPSLSLIYTYNLRGNIELLPRLYSFLRTLRAQVQRFEDDDTVNVCAVQPSARRTLVVDFGGSCAADVWHCTATGGRSVPIVLDAMGYDAAVVTLGTEGREKLASAVQMALVDPAHPYSADGVGIAAARQPDSPDFQIIAQLEPALRLADHALYPPLIESGQIGIVHVRGARDPISEIYPLPASTPPDPTIAGIVDFVLGEARYYQKRRS